MTRAKRNLIVTTLGIGAVLLVVLAVLPRLIDVNSYRGLIQSKAEAALGRKVTLGVMTLSVFPSVAIQVKDPEVEGLLRARTLAVGVRLLPLLFGGDISLKSVALDQPEITLTRRADGRWDAPGTGGAEVTPSDAPATGADATQPGTASAFALSNLRITGATVRLIDQSIRSKSGRSAPVAVDFKMDLSGSISRNESGNLRAEFDGRLSGEGLILDARGSVSHATGSGQHTEFDITVDQADVEIGRARELAASLGQAWPLPDGILISRNLKLGGRCQGRIGGLEPTEILVSDLVLHGADLSLSRDQRGVWNFEVMTQASPSRAEGGVPAVKPVVTMKNLRMTGAKVALHDDATGGAPVDLKLVDMNLLIEEYAPARPLVLELESTIEPGGAKLILGGSIPMELESRQPMPFTVDLKLRGLDAQAVSPWLVSLIDMAAVSGTVDVRAKMTGSWPADVSASGAVELHDVRRIQSENPMTAGAEFELTAKDRARSIQFSKLDLSIGQSRLAVRGSIDNKSVPTRVDLEIPSSSIDGRDLETVLALAGGAPGVAITAGRPIRIQARVKGDPKNRKDLEVTGSIEVADLSLQHPAMTKPLEHVQAKLTLGNDRFEVSAFTGVIGGSDVAGVASVAGFAAPRVSFTLTSRHADFWELMSFVRNETPNGTGARPTAGGSAGAPADDDITDKINARGTLAIAEGSFGTLAFTNLTTTLSMQQSVIRLDPVAMKLYNGSMTGTATLDMSRTPPVYSVLAETAGIDTNALLKANLQMKDTLSGALTGRLAVTTSGATRDQSLSNARGDGTIRIENGHIGGLNVLKVLSRASDLLGERSLREVSARLAKEGTDFSLLNANLRIAGGKVVSEGLTLTSPDIELKDDGELNMNAGTIKVVGQIIFSQALSEAMTAEKSKAVEYFWDDRLGRVNLPITLSGPVDAPTPNIDWHSASGRLAERKVREAVGEKLKKTGLAELLGVDTRPSAPAERPKAAVPVATGELAVAVEESGFSGNLLAPDLRIKGTLRGTGITKATVRITDTKGKVLHEESLERKVEKFYTAHDRAAPAAINFRVEVEGARMAGLRGGVRVVITLTDVSGRVVEEPFEVSR